MSVILSIPQIESNTMSAETHSNIPFAINLLFFMTAINLLRFYDCNLLTALNPVFQYVQTISHVKAQRR